MKATNLYIAGGLVRTVKGQAEDIGAALKQRQLAQDDGFRQFQTTDGDWITVAANAVILVENAQEEKKCAIGFTA